MPNTPVYSLPFESPPNPQVNAEPGITLHGGSAGNDDILAKEVETELERIDDAASDLGDRVTTLEEQVFQLTREELSGEVGTGTDLVIPAEYRGEFDSYILEIDGHVGQGLRALVVLVNGLGTSEYRAVATAVDPADMSVDESSKLNATAFPRFGFLGSVGAFHRVILRPSTKGQTGFVQWICQGWANQGGAESKLTFSGGRWNGSVQDLTHFTVRTAGSGSTEDEWGGNSFATLWGRV